MPIRITNPIPGGQSYTTVKRAKDFIQRNIAVMTDTGELYFLNNTPEIRIERQRLEYEARIRAGMCFWNGQVKDPYAMKRPGEVRS
jgi:hypothetical protein